MINPKVRLLFVTFILLTSNMAIADVDIKLDCHLDVSSIYFGRTEEKSSVNRTVEIYQKGDFISIIPGGVVASITSSKHEKTIDCVKYFKFLGFSKCGSVYRLR